MISKVKTQNSVSHFEPKQHSPPPPLLPPRMETSYATRKKSMGTAGLAFCYWELKWSPGGDSEINVASNVAHKCIVAYETC